MSQWLGKANCRNEDPEIFFADPRYPKGRKELERATKLCQSCPVQIQCLESVLYYEAREQMRSEAAGNTRTKRYGIYAGLTGEERQRQYGRTA